MRFDEIASHPMTVDSVDVELAQPVLASIQLFENGRIDRGVCSIYALYLQLKQDTIVENCLARVSKVPMVGPLNLELLF